MTRNAILLLSLPSPRPSLTCAACISPASAFPPMGALMCCCKEDAGDYQTMATDYPRAQYNASRSTSGTGGEGYQTGGVDQGYQSGGAGADGRKNQ